MSGFSEYQNYDALGLAELVRNGEVTADELLDAAIARCDAVNPQINAVIHRFDAKARAQNAALDKSATFAGVPFLIKDLLADYAGEPMRQGSRFFADYIAPNDSELVKRFKQCGLAIFGKTNTPEFGITPITDPETQGSTRNPWNLEHTVGGSSGGSGAAVAAGIVPMASGGDGGGSIRIPAACNGLVGLKTTKARYPSGPDRGELWYGMAVEGVVSRTVRDTAALLDACAGSDAGSPNFPPPPEGSYVDEVSRDPGKLRIAYSIDPLLGEALDAECAAAVQATAKQLAALGHEVVEATPKLDREAFIHAFVIVVGADTNALIKWGETVTGKKARQKDFEMQTWAAKRMGDAASAADFAWAIQYLQGVGREMGRFMENQDVWLTSTLGVTPPKCGALRPAGIEIPTLMAVNNLPLGRLATKRSLVVDAAKKVYNYMSTTPIANATGQPAISLPLQWAENGLPIGMQFQGRFGDEATLLRLAGQLEQAHPWADRRPTL